MSHPPTDQTPPYGYPHAPARRSLSARLTATPWLTATLVLVTLSVLTVCWVGVIGTLTSNSQPAQQDDAAAQTLQSEPPRQDTAGSVALSTAAPTSAQVVEKTVVIETEKIPYETVRVNDASLAKGKTKVRTAGKAGVRTLSYEVTTVNGVQTDKKLISAEVTAEPVTEVIAVGTKSTKPKQTNCHPSYTPCVPKASDADCAGGSGDGPVYVYQAVKVIGPDEYRLDNDHDGWGCEDD